MATYVLVIKIASNAHIQVGRLGDTAFREGLYLYVGSAKRGLDKRIRRHLAKEKRLHWHIDYILDQEGTTIVGVWTKQVDQECETANKIGDLAETEIARKGIGASDCTCPTHFYSFDGELSEIEHHLKAHGFRKKRL